MKINVFLLSVTFAVITVSSIFSKEIEIRPTGGDDAESIQSALDGLGFGDTLHLKGDFIFGKTLYLPSDFVWMLDGSMTLKDNAILDDVGYVDPSRNIDATRYTGITEKTGGVTNIKMIGGTYNGNSTNNSTKKIRLINFVHVKNSNFHDMTVTDVSDDNFTLGPGCQYNECRNLIGSFAGGNALTDKGDHNSCYDCIAENSASDGWTPKCRNSEFYRCIARRNEGPGFGMFCRIDGSGNPLDLGEAIEGNKFYACESYENNAAGFSFNISSTSGEGGTIRNNYVQALCYNNAESGVRFRNTMPNSYVENNEINLLCYGNLGRKKNSTEISSRTGGLGTEAKVDAPVTGITGYVICYDNIGSDVNVDQAINCNIVVYNPNDQTAADLKKGAESNKITEIGFKCDNILEQWCQQKYCDEVAGVITGANYQSVKTYPLFSLAQNYPNPLSKSTSIEYTIPRQTVVSIKVCDISGRELRSLVNENQYEGHYKIEFNRRGLSDGTYYYRMVANDYAETKKFILRK